MTSEELAREDDGPTARHVVQALIGGFLVLFALGVLAGFLAAVADHGVRHGWKVALVIAGVVSFAALGGSLLRRSLPHFFAGKLSPRTKKARSILYASGAVGAVLGVVLQLGAFEADPAMLAEGPLPPLTAAIAIAVWLIAVPILSWIWWKNIDEHEASAYKDGALVGIYAYSAIAPTWWFGWRGGFLPEPQEMITFMLVLTAWGLTWMVRRFA